MVPDCEVVAIAEINRELAGKVAARWGVPNVYASHEEMLAKEQLDGIVASQPFTRHGTLIPELLASGKPVFTDKPIAGSVEMGEKIVAATKANQTWMMIGYHKRSDPATMFAKAEIDRLKQTGELGKLTYIRILMPAGDWIASGFNQNIATTEDAFALPFDPSAPDMDQATNGAYTAFVNYYIHQVNLMRHLTASITTISRPDVDRHRRRRTERTCDWQTASRALRPRGWRVGRPRHLLFQVDRRRVRQARD